MITLTACALGTLSLLPKFKTPVSESNLHGQVATIGGGDLTQTIAPVITTPFPPPSDLSVLSTYQKIYQSTALGIQFDLPENWYLQEFTDAQIATVVVTSFDPANPPHKLEWTDQTISMQFRRLPAGSAPQNLDAWVESAKPSAVATHLTLFEEERFLIANQPAARLTLVSGSGGIIHQIMTILDGRHYEINIQGNLDLGKSALSTLHPISSGGLKPAESETPAAGICMEPQDEYVAIELGVDKSGMPLAGRCIVLLPTQRIKLINRSNEHIVTQFANYHIDLPVGAEILLDNPVDEYLAHGVHYLQMAPALWLKPAGEPATPVATMPSPLSYYSNLEVGWTLTIPPGWNVDEYGLAMPNREVIFYPNNAEPFVAYLSVSLDPRTRDQIINAFAQNVPDAIKEDMIFNGLPAVKFTHPFGRHEYYIPYANRITSIATDRPMDRDVQMTLLSISFTPTSLARYTNDELRYTLIYPIGWVVDENGMAAQNKEVRFYPVNAEPFVSYLDHLMHPGLKMPRTLKKPKYSMRG